MRSDSTGTWSRSANTVGFWAAISTAVLSALWFLTFMIQQAAAPFPEWTGEGAYVASVGYSPLHLLPFYPSILLAPVFLVLLATIHVSAAPDKKVWSLSALALGILYAAMGSIQYNIQLVSVRRSLLNSESEGLAMFIQANPNSITSALANCYVYMSLAMLSAAFVFGEGRLERWIRRLLITAGLAAPLQLAWSVFDLSTIILVLSVVPWLIGAVGATILLAVLFSRKSRNP